MRALPSVNATLFDEAGEATPVLRGALANVPAGALLDEDGRASPLFRRYLSGVLSRPLPVNFAPLADADGRATRAFTLLLMGAP